MARLLRQRVTWRLLGLILSETLLIIGAVTVSTWLVSDGGAFRAGTVGKALLVAGVCQICLYYAELYEFDVLADRWEMWSRLLAALGSACLTMGVLYSLVPSLVICRGVFILASILMISGIAGWRCVFAFVSTRAGDSERLLLVGTSAATVALARELYTRQELGVHIVGFIDANPERIGEPVLNPGIIGTIEDIPAIVESQSVDRVVLGLGDARGRLPMDKLLDMKLSGVTFDHLATVYEEYTGKIAVENLRPSWFVFSEGFPVSRSRLALKRAADLLAAAVGLLCAAPLIAVAGVAVKCTSSGPAFFTQQRVGRNGCAFTLYKLRSMYADAEAVTGAVWSTPGDARVTPLGRLLRATRVDELPQLLNVLRGEMSLVGPRPERPEFVRELTRRIPYYGQRHTVKPGLTGWAQVRYHYGATVEDALEKLQYDLFYVKNMCFALDLFIIFKTMQTVVLRRGT